MEIKELKYLTLSPRVSPARAGWEAAWWPGARLGGSQPQHPEPAGRAVTERQAGGEETSLAQGDSMSRPLLPGIRQAQH